MHWKSLVAGMMGLSCAVVSGAEPGLVFPIEVGAFEQQTHTRYTTDQGLPSNDVQSVEMDSTGRPMAITGEGAARFDGDTWVAVAYEPTTPAALDAGKYEDLHAFVGGEVDIRGVVAHGVESAVAADSGLYFWDGQTWSVLKPREGSIRWAPVDVRAVQYDAEGRLWFASPQGTGYRVSDEEWKLFTGAEGLPFNDFTCMAAGPGSVWFGTTNGAIQYREGAFSFRQGGRWLLDNHVKGIVVDDEGSAWLATEAGISRISYETFTLSSKARFYEEEIEKYHRRTSWGYVNPARLSAPGDKSTAEPVFTDNDGHNTGLYLGAVSLAYAATGDAIHKKRAQDAFEALAFLSEVTQGGTHPAPEGFIARAVLPTSEPDPNPDFDLAYDIRRNEADALWKIIQPRWPVDETGEWYWKNDSSSDELTGHFFGYALYFDHVCETEAEKEAVRTVVRRVIDHVIDNGYNLVDYDGTPTRWGHFSPDDLNRNEEWVWERGLNSYSILTYLAIAHRITGDAQYREHYLALALDHGYGMNGMTQPREVFGPGTAGQPDDNMAFMNYYHLIRYETDPKLLSMYYHAIYRHWQLEQYERSTFMNFVYAACCHGKARVDHWGETDISPPPRAFDDAIDTLKRYPLDLVNWPASNAHRIDMVPLQGHLGQAEGRAGHRVDGHVFPIDEHHEIYWDRDPWHLASTGDGTRLREGFHYLLAYYMGRAHGFIED